jgi:hypothetical protein
MTHRLEILSRRCFYRKSYSNCGKSSADISAALKRGESHPRHQLRLTSDTRAPTPASQSPLSASLQQSVASVLRQCGAPYPWTCPDAPLASAPFQRAVRSPRPPPSLHPLAAPWQRNRASPIRYSQQHLASALRRCSKLMRGGQPAILVGYPGPQRPHQLLLLLLL